MGRRAMLTAVLQATPPWGDWLGSFAWLISPAMFQIIVADLILSGDNAVVIAMACRSLPPQQRKWGILLGAMAAVLMRVVFTVGVTSLLSTPWLKVIGSALLFWIAVKLLIESDDGSHEVNASSNLWGAVQTVVIADVVMSLDNVLAIAAAAKGDWVLIIIGLAISIPIIIFGATLITALLTRYPILIWAGAALLGWIAGELLVTDIGMRAYAEGWASAIGVRFATLELISASLFALLVVGVAWLLRRRQLRGALGEAAE
jgi:YjbE family integral membrane protein